MEINLGKFLRRTRKAAGMSQENMAHELHMSISNISRLETEKYELKAVDLIKWVNITGSQEILAAMILGLDVAVLQQALEAVSSFVATIFLGGIL